VVAHQRVNFNHPKPKAKRGKRSEDDQPDQPLANRGNKTLPVVEVYTVSNPNTTRLNAAATRPAVRALAG
jgi:hypothetical protein